MIDIQDLNTAELLDLKRDITDELNRRAFEHWVLPVEVATIPIPIISEAELKAAAERAKRRRFKDISMKRLEAFDDAQRQLYIEQEKEKLPNRSSKPLFGKDPNQIFNNKRRKRW